MPVRAQMDVAKLSDFLAGLPLFSNFKPEEIRALLRIMELWHYNPDEVIFKEGERGDSCFLIVSGTVRVRKRINDKFNKSVAFLKPGTIFGQVALIDRGPRSATCVAFEETEVLKLSRSAFDALFHTGHPTAYKFQDMIARIMAQQLRIADRALARITEEIKRSIEKAEEEFKQAASATEEWHIDPDELDEPPPAIKTDYTKKKT